MFSYLSLSSKTNDDFSGVHRSHLMFVHVCADSETARHQLANSRGLRDGDWTWFHGREFLQISPDSRWIYPQCITRFSETLDFGWPWVAYLTTRPFGDHGRRHLARTSRPPKSVFAMSRTLRVSHGMLVEYLQDWELKSTQTRSDWGHHKGFRWIESSFGRTHTHTE